MSRSLQPFWGLTLDPGELMTLTGYSRMLNILDITGADFVSVRMPGESFELIKERSSIELPQGQEMSGVQLRNDNASAITLDVILSIGRVFVDQEGQVESVLSNILEELDGTNESLDYIPQVTVTSVSAVKVLDVDADRKEAEIQQKIGGTAYVYLGNDNTVTDTNWMVMLAPGASKRFVNWTGELYAIASSGTQYLGGSTK